MDIAAWLRCLGLEHYEAAFRAMQTPANDDTTTLGLAVTIEGGQLKVISPEDGSPAARAVE